MDLAPELLRRTAAAHEAGHAVVAWALGWEVLSVSIEEDGRGGCRTASSVALDLVDEIAIAVERPLLRFYGI
jgi:hypothetical protein